MMELLKVEEEKQMSCGFSSLSTDDLYVLKLKCNTRLKGPDSVRTQFQGTHTHWILFLWLEQMDLLKRRSTLSRNCLDLFFSEPQLVREPSGKCLSCLECCLLSQSSTVGPFKTGRRTVNPLAHAAKDARSLRTFYSHGNRKQQREQTAARFVQHGFFFLLPTHWAPAAVSIMPPTAWPIKTLLGYWLLDTLGCSHWERAEKQQPCHGVTLGVKWFRWFSGLYLFISWNK